MEKFKIKEEAHTFKYLSQAKDWGKIKSKLSFDILKFLEEEITEWEENEGEIDTLCGYDSSSISWWQGAINTDDLIEIYSEEEGV